MKIIFSLFLMAGLALGQCPAVPATAYTSLQTFLNGLACTGAANAFTANQTINPTTPSGSALTIGAPVAPGGTVLAGSINVAGLIYQSGIALAVDPMAFGAIADGSSHIIATI